MVHTFWHSGLVHLFPIPYLQSLQSVLYLGISLSLHCYTDSLHSTRSDSNYIWGVGCKLKNCKQLSGHAFLTVNIGVRRGPRSIQFSRLPFPST